MMLLFWNRYHEFDNPEIRFVISDQSKYCEIMCVPKE